MNDNQDLETKGILIIDFQDEHKEEMFKIHNEVLPENDKMTKQNFYDEFSEPSRKYFVAKINENIVGYLGLFECEDDENIIGIAIKKEFQNKGIGTRLIEKAVEFGIKNKKKSLSLEVDEKNIKAFEFYQKNKFVVTNVRKKYYKDNDAYIMFRYL